MCSICALEPHIFDAAAVSRPGLPMKTVEVFDGKVGDFLWFVGKAQIDGAAALAFVVRINGAPVTDAPARLAKVEAESLFAAEVSGRGSRYFNVFSFVAIGPQRTVSRARGAIASQCAL